MSSNSKPLSGHDSASAEKRARKKQQKADAAATVAVPPTTGMDRVQALNDAAMARNIADKHRASVQYPTLANGKPNPKYADLLFEYPEVSGQQWGVYSFISPEREIRRREMFMFEQFVRQWSYTTSVTAFSEFMQFMSVKHAIPIESLQADLAEFIADKTNNLASLDVSDEFTGYVETHFEKLDEKYEKKHGFETSVRGFAAIGNFSTEEKAGEHARKIREINSDHDILVTKNFHWVPFDPDRYRIANVDYLNPELNRLHQEKKENAAKAKAEFDQRVYDAKRKAIEANVENAKKYGTKVSQTMDENGNLVGAHNMLDLDAREAAPEVLTNASKMDVTEG
jgi:hypothetical protein